MARSKGQKPSVKPSKTRGLSKGKMGHGGHHRKPTSKVSHGPGKDHMQKGGKMKGHK